MVRSNSTPKSVGKYLLAKSVEEVRHLEEMMRLIEEMMHQTSSRLRTAQLRNHIKSLPYEHD